MALSLGKLTILVGAGILGSVLAKEGQLPSFSDVLSGALKVALKPSGKNDSTSSASKPKSDALAAQVNNLRNELQRLASNRPVTIVNTGTVGGRRYGVIIVIVVVGYGYVWWKGWKIPDLMFASKRSLSDACNSVAKQLEQIYSSIMTTKKDLSSKLDESTHKFDEIAECSATTKVEAAEVRGEVSKFTIDLRSVSHKIKTLETKWGEIQETQDETKEKVGRLLLCTLDAENRFADAAIQDSPSRSLRPAIEGPQMKVSSRTVSLPPVLSPDSPSSSAPNGSTTQANLRHSISDVSTKKSGEISSETVVPSQAQAEVSDTTEKALPSSELPTKPATKSSAGFLSRTISATQYFKFK